MHTKVYSKLNEGVELKGKKGCLRYDADDTVCTRAHNLRSSTRGIITFIANHETHSVKFPIKVGLTSSVRLISHLDRHLSG